MDKKQAGYIQLARIITARVLDVPPDDVDMFAIFDCVIRAIEEKVEKGMDELELAPKNRREIEAIVCENGEKVILMMMGGEYPFGDFVSSYESWYEENLAMIFLKMKLDSSYN